MFWGAKANQFHKRALIYFLYSYNVNNYFLNNCFSAQCDIPVTNRDNILTFQIC